MKNPWDQLPEEPDECYARFLLYQGLGPGRTILAAYTVFLSRFQNATGRNKPQSIPGHWGEDSGRYRWVDRVQAWDVAMLKKYGERVIVKFIGSLDKIAEKTAEALAKEGCRPKKWSDVLAALNILAQYVTPDVARSVQPPDSPVPECQPDRSAVE